MEATTTARKRPARPMSYYWGVVKDMDDINAMIDESERQIAAGETIPDEEVWRKYDEEFVMEEQQELELA